MVLSPIFRKGTHCYLHDYIHPSLPPSLPPPLPLHRLKSAGHVIIVSGSTLLLCFIGILGLPVNALQSSALGCAITVIFSMLVGLTLVPALLFLFGEKLLGYDRSLKLFLHGVFPCFPAPYERAKRIIQEEEKGEETEEHEESTDDLRHYGKGWFNLGQFILKPRNGMIILVLLFALLIPFAIKTGQLRSYPDWRADVSSILGCYFCHIIQK